MKLPLYNQEAQVVGDAMLADGVFGVPANPDLVFQVVTSQSSNMRQNLAHAKGRGEVRGGGKKPWKQKGTGRARHGSIRSPIWKGGGVTHGPTKERNFEKKINRKVARRALAMTLSAKAKDSQLFIIDNVVLEQAKTKLMAGIFKKFFPLMTAGGTASGKPSSVLFVLPGGPHAQTLYRTSKNIPNISAVRAGDINALKILSAKYVLMLQESARVIEELFARKAPKAAVQKTEEPKAVVAKKVQSKKKTVKK